MFVRLNIHKYFPCLRFTFNFLNLLNINYIFKYFYFFNIYLFDCTRSWLQHVVSWPGNECGPSTLGTWSLSHWSTKEVPQMFLIFITFFFFWLHWVLVVACGSSSLLLWSFSRSVVCDILQPMDCSTPGFIVHHQLPELAQTQIQWVGDAIQPSHPLLSPSPPAFNFPSIGVFSNESDLRISWPKYWSFSFSISPSNEYSGLTSFRIDWFDLLAVQGILKNPLQHHSSQGSILWHSALWFNSHIHGLPLWVSW